MKYNNLSTLDTSTDGSLGGVCRIQYAPKEWLASAFEIDLNDNSITRDLVLIDGKSWLEAKPLQQNKALNESPKETNAGLMYEQELQFEVNKDELARNSILNQLSYREFIVVYTDHNGATRVLGTKHKGATLRSKYTTEGNVTGRSWFAVQLSYASAEPIPHCYTQILNGGTGGGSGGGSGGSGGAS